MRREVLWSICVDQAALIVIHDHFLTATLTVMLTCQTNYNSPLTTGTQEAFTIKYPLEILTMSVDLSSITSHGKQATEYTLPEFCQPWWCEKSQVRRPVSNMDLHQTNDLENDRRHCAAIRSLRIIEGRHHYDPGGICSGAYFRFYLIIHNCSPRRIFYRRVSSSSGDFLTRLR